GTRRLKWLAPAGKDPKGKKAAAGDADGPEALVLRAELRPVYVQGADTLIPLDRGRSVEYDADKKAVTLKGAAGPKADESLTGTTDFTDESINLFALKADVDRGEAGIATKKFTVGDKGVRSLRFPAPKAPAASAAGRPAVVTTNDKITHKVT